MRAYQIFDAYLVMEVHTETTIHEGEQELQVYGRHLQVSSECLHMSPLSLKKL